MHLKSLTLRGFKSFASATTLGFEPGINCVVGPNGSGKSNVVDAIAWVMGEQGAKSLRGGKMEDVIFAGTADKAPLGRAEVMLTIDNADGALPIEFSEVTISRTLFRTGGSEYAINGEPARLLDIQELLSDSGIGREMHVIVGQGRLGAILDATPEDRRGYIEEAAGVLKHRKRKEKALRKLDAMSANLTRLQDLTHELRRQLKPLGKQAEVARRAQVIQTDVRDARLRLLADDLVTLRDTLNKEEADEAMLKERRTKLDTDLAAATSREATLEQESVDDATTLAQANELNTRLTALGERYRGLISLAQERAAHLHDDEAAPQGADPDQLEASAHAAEAEAEQIATELIGLVEAMKAAEAAASNADRQLHEATEAAKQKQARISSHREHGVRLEGALQSATAKVESREAEIARLANILSEVTTRIETHNAELAELESDGSVDQGLQELSAALEETLAVRKDLETQLETARREYESAQREAAGLAARLEALELSADKGASALFADHGLPALGSVSEGIRIEPGYETAIEAAVDWFAQVDAVAVADLAGAIAAVEHLAAAQAGQATILVANAPSASAISAPLPDGARRAVDLIRASDDPHAAAISSAIKSLLADVVVVENPAAAKAVLDAAPNAVVVTSTGDTLTSTVVRGGHEGSGRLAIANAIEQTKTDQEQLVSKVESGREAVEQLRAQLDEAKAATKAAREAFDAAKSTANKHTSAVALAASKRDSAQAELNRTQSALQAAQGNLVNDKEALVNAQTKLDEHLANKPDPVDAAADQEQVEQLRATVMQARRTETESRLAVRTAEERQSAHLSRAKELLATAAAEREARAAALEAAKERRRQAEIAVEVLAVAKQALIVLEASQIEARVERDEVSARVQSHSSELAGLRVSIRELNEQISQLTNDVHRDEVARAEQRMRVQQLEEKALEEYGVNGEELLAEYGPDVLVPPSAVAPGDELDPDAPQAQPYPYVRAEQEKRLKTAEKAMNLLGKVNPLALEEFSAMEERYTFLNNQLEDLKASRKDLLDIVEEVDERIQQVFAEAFDDVQREFKGIFGRLFPGGEGRLILTAPDDLLTTGVEVEARPPGKKVKRLSLLSGGERSLTTVAFLVALFKARPSPFYIMDEVEAALDDVNLGRLISLMEELRGTSQLLIITHQKRTMEIADALYGVTMRGGVTQVISQRMREMKDSAGSEMEELVDAH